MAWLALAPTPWTSTKKYITETQWTGYFYEGQFYITGSQSRTRTIYSQFYSAMTEAVADALALDLSDNANVTDAHSDRQNNAGAYSVTVTYDVKGAWS